MKVGTVRHSGGERTNDSPGKAPVHDEVVVLLAQLSDAEYAAPLKAIEDNAELQRFRDGLQNGHGSGVRDSTDSRIVVEQTPVLDRALGHKRDRGDLLPAAPYLEPRIYTVAGPESRLNASNVDLTTRGWVQSESVKVRAIGQVSAGPGAGAVEIVVDVVAEEVRA